ncbi:UDP-N-acetylglucosamine 4,6-dehydratase (inverting) [Alphaproteobacteria bacterium]|nr:UDP-N-acetylglucosamine 4,6-dehydratase (inverting) [Alphaproteobacteria bacterium]
MSLNNKNILITGGTGSFGSKFIELVLKKYKPSKLVIFSRDEQKQYEMSQFLSEEKYPNIRYFIGDVRDKSRLERACANIDFIIHAAAMKHVTAAEYNPTECIATNILGAQNVIDAAISNNVKKVIALSTDKAASPINLYGATKLCSDKLFIAANNLAGKHKTRFSVVRYGNVINSRGSVIPHFRKLLQEGKIKLPITDIKMTRFIINLNQGVKFVLDSLFSMSGGEIFVPKIPSINIIDLVTCMAGEGQYDEVGIRPGEKLHEVMIPKEESLNCIDMNKYYIIQPMFSWWNTDQLKLSIGNKGKAVSKSFEYSSDSNKDFLTIDGIKNILLQE